MVYSIFMTTLKVVIPQIDTGPSVVRLRFIAWGLRLSIVSGYTLTLLCLRYTPPPPILEVGFVL